MEYPSEGVAIQEACYANYGTCFVDTFYSAKLKKELTDLYAASKYAVFGYVDSVRNYETYDTTLFMGQPYYVDTFTTERISVGIHTLLKDSMPDKHLTFIERWVAFSGNPFATTYIPMKDTPFVAFFDQYDSIRKMGLGPMDGCFFEPTMYQIYGNRIHKKGLVGFRMPGVSITMEEFFQAVKHDPVPVPPVSILPRRALRALVAPGRGAGRYDLNGRRLGPGKARTWVYRLLGEPALERGPAETIDGVSRPR